jgi:predicted ArsR family transcriptional regulator
MTTDQIAEQISWLDELITDPDNAALFANATQSAIQQELAAHWTKENRLDLLNELSGRFSEADILTVIDKIIFTNCQRNWRQVGLETGDNSLEKFLELLWGPLPDMGFEFTSEKQGNQTQFHVTQCSIYELAKTLGAEKWLYHLVCLTDEPSVAGFNADVKFDRTKTLMQGHAYCDHCYTDLSAENK